MKTLPAVIPSHSAGFLLSPVCGGGAGLEIGNADGLIGGVGLIGSVGLAGGVGLVGSVGLVEGVGLTVGVGGWDGDGVVSAMTTTVEVIVPTTSESEFSTRTGTLNVPGVDESGTSCGETEKPAAKFTVKVESAGAPSPTWMVCVVGLAIKSQSALSERLPIDVFPLALA